MKNYKYRYILALDPSGNYTEGFGTTGVCLFDTEIDRIIRTDYIAAKNYDSKELYWKAHLDYIWEVLTNIVKYDNLIVVIEEYSLYADKATAQINSKMETPKLLGLLQYYLTIVLKLPYKMQTASSVKNRWNNQILLHKGYIRNHGNRYFDMNDNAINRHCIDAIRHAVHFYTFYNVNINQLEHSI